MCIVAIAHQASSRFPLIVAANRDESHRRPAAAADWWDGPGSLLAGRDLAAGGSWLGVTGSGRFAAVTNIFDASTNNGSPPAAAECSRGALVTEFLQGSLEPAEFADAAAAAGAHYGPFNLLLRFKEKLHLVSNRNSSAALEDGVHVLSNNAPGLHWAKLDVLATAIETAETETQEDLADYLIEALSGADARGSLERAADSLFVVGDDFGTRCTTILTIDNGGRAEFVEQRFGAGGISAGRSEYVFHVR